MLLAFSAVILGRELDRDLERLLEPDRLSRLRDLELFLELPLELDREDLELSLDPDRLRERDAERLAPNILMFCNLRWRFRAIFIIMYDHQTLMNSLAFTMFIASSNFSSAPSLNVTRTPSMAEMINGTALCRCSR